jgi:predicted AlkP superfamily pyrophosphatase or phosphodiesterase
MKSFKIVVFIFVFLTFGVPFKNIAQKPRQIDHPYVIMLSMDAFRWDYAEKLNLKNLKAIASEGVTCKALIPCFPSVTFPNHYSIATGLYPDHHGLVQNNFYDSVLKAKYSIGNRKAVENGKFYGGEPIWVTAEKQGVKSASYFWVGTEAPIQNIQPSIWKKYDHTFPYNQRLDSVLSWLDLPESKRPHLITWYIPEPDEVTHDFGPYSSEANKMIYSLDSLVGAFFAKIKSHPLADKINIIIVSDHGMSLLSEEKTEFFDDYIKKEWIQFSNGHNPQYNFTPYPQFIDSVITGLQKAKHLRAWKKQNVPVYLHYGTNYRIGDIVIVADSAWSMKWRNDKPIGKGTHGYDPTNSDMYGIFYAYGPAFQKGYVANAMQNIEIYNLICKILKLNPAPNDGNLGNVRQLLLPENKKHKVKPNHIR